MSMPIGQLVAAARFVADRFPDAVVEEIDYGHIGFCAANGIGDISMTAIYVNTLEPFSEMTVSLPVTSPPG